MSPTPLPDLVDDSDTCTTSQFLAADCTAVDAEPLGADATGEIDAIDILEIRTPAPGSAARTSRLPILVLTPRIPLRPPPSTVTRRAHPSSIAPVALDVMAPRVPSASVPSHAPVHTGSTMLDLLGTAGAQRSSRLFALGSSLAALCLVAATVGAALGYERSSHAPASSTSAPGFHAPRTPDVLEAREEVTMPPPDASGKAHGGTTDAPPVVGPSIVRPPLAPAPALHRPAAMTGVLHVPGPVSGALVDGVPHRVSGNELTVTCGRHRVKLPERAVRNVDVPCGGSATF